MREVVVKVGKKPVTIQVDDGVTNEEIQAALVKRYKKEPLKPLEFSPAKLELGELKILVDQPKIPDVNHKSTIEIPDAKLIAKSVLQAQTSNTETVSKLQEILTDMAGSKIDFPQPCDWECKIVRNSQGAIDKLLFKSVH